MGGWEGRGGREEFAGSRGMAGGGGSPAVGGGSGGRRGGSAPSRSVEEGGGPADEGHLADGSRRKEGRRG